MLLWPHRANIYVARKHSFTKVCNKGLPRYGKVEGRGIVKINTFGTAQKIRKQNNTKEM